MKKKGDILIIDDNEAMLVSLRMLLKNVFEDVQTSATPNAIPSLLRKKKPDVVLLDMNFGRGINNGNEGLFWLKEIKRLEPEVAVVLFTAYADIDLAVKGIKEGAADFVVKPFENVVLVEKLTALRRKEAGRLTPRLAELCYWGQSKTMEELHVMAEKVAVTDANILITGENGTGKEVLAREIHRLSRRSGRQMVTVDMGAVSETLFESELFGYMRGAFTDAKSDKPGKMELAEGSTLFMDEIGNLSYPLQAKLLNALQSRTVTRIGGTKEIPINLRLITATNRNLQQMVQEGTFREDLLYRINTICLHLPPLRERKEDIMPLAERFVGKFASLYGKPPITLDEKTQKALVTYPWPGNIRELEHCMERAVILGEVALPDLPASSTSSPVSSVSLASMERDLIARTIHDCEGNLTLVAHRLDISRQTLYNKIKKYGL